MDEQLICRMAAMAMDAIVLDLQGRRGLGDEWDNIDHDVQQEIRAFWTRLIAAQFETQATSRPTARDLSPG